MKIRQWAKDNWVKLFLCGFSILALLFVNLYHLESITGSQISAPEVEALTTSNTLRGIASNPLNAPFKIVQYILLSLNSSSIYFLRLASVLFGLATVWLFYALSKHWFSPLIAWLGTSMFATSTLYLHHARLITPAILLPLSLLALLWSIWSMNNGKQSSVRLALFLTIFAVALYIPGVVWFVLLIIALQRRHIISSLKKISWTYLILGGIVGSIFIIPLVRAFALNTSLVSEWLALPSILNLKDLAINFVSVPLALTVQSPFNPAFNLGRLPIIDVLTLALIILGAYAFIIRFNLTRTRALMLTSIISWLLITMGETNFAVLLPLVYLLAAGGIMFLLQQWYSVFPKNPIARNLGLILVVAVVGISIFYNLDRYFIAWQHNPATVEAFQETVPANLVQ